MSGIPNIFSFSEKPIVDRNSFIAEPAPPDTTFSSIEIRCLQFFAYFSMSSSSRGFINLISIKEQFNSSAISNDKSNTFPKEKMTISESTSLITLAKVINDVDSEIVIFSFGNVLDLSLDIADELNCSLIDMRFIKPLDEELIEKYAKNCKHLISIEENVVSGGAGSAINEFLSTIGFSEKLKIFGIPDKFPIVGSQSDQREAAGLTREEIIRKLSLELNLEELNKKISTQ